MKLVVTIRMDNAAFAEESGTEAARLLRLLACDFECRDLLPGEDKQLQDINGNSVGNAKVIA